MTKQEIIDELMYIADQVEDQPDDYEADVEEILRKLLMNLG